jgi:hypothetical protein
VCANRDTSPDHCGTCGHSCGGGLCTQGHCGLRGPSPPQCEGPRRAPALRPGIAGDRFGALPRSSARSTSLLSEMAKARKFGTASSIVSRAEGAKLISPILRLCVHRFAQEGP